MSFLRAALQAVLIFQTSLALSAAVIYDGGSPDGVDGASISAQTAAQQFTLADATTLQGLLFFGSAFVNDVPSHFGGTIGFRFLADNAGAPGTSLFLGSDSSVQLINNGTQNPGMDEYRFLVNLGSVPLAAGTYWLAFHEGLMGTADDGTPIFWSSTSSAPPGTADFYATFQADGLAPYGSSELFQTAFQLRDTPAYTSVPEPSTWVLVLSAGGLLFLQRNRRGRQ